MANLDPMKYAVAWIAPLEIEARAALHMLDERHQGRFPVGRGDDYVYHAGTMGGHNIIIATLPAGQKYGTASAAALASQLKKFFPNLWFGLLVGVAAGLPDLSRDPVRDIRLGDVLVSLPEGEIAGLIAYDLGKETDTGFQPLRLGQYLTPTEPIVRSAMGSIRMEGPYDSKKLLPYYDKIRDKEHASGTFADPGQDLDVLYFHHDDGSERIAKRDRRPDSRRICVWYGPIGSGDKLWRNMQKKNELRDQYGLIGLEMEAAGIMDHIPVGVIRGACDYGDGHKNKIWQPYAAAMAAAYARALLDEIPPRSSSLSEAFQAQLRIGDTLRQSGRFLDELTERPETPPTPSIMIPFGRDSDFVERGATLGQIGHRCGQPGARAALVGLGGVGKSQLAIEYAYRTQERLSNTWVFWIHASNKTRFEQGFRDIAAHVRLAGRQAPNANLFQLVHDWLQDKRNGPWVIILDNVDDAGFLKSPTPNVKIAATPNIEIAATMVDDTHQRPLMSNIPYCQHGSVLITSRSKGAALELVEDSNIITIDPMTEKDALRLFQKKLGSSHDELCTDKLAATLEYMPLAIIQAAAYVVQRRPRYSIQRYLEEFHNSDKKQASLLSLPSGQLRRDTEAKNSILITWQISFNYVYEKTPSAARLLSYMSFCDRQGIPESLLRGQVNNINSKTEQNQPNAEYDLSAEDRPNKAAADAASIDSGNDGGSSVTEQRSNCSDDDRFENDILMLRNFSFITANGDGTTFAMHRLVQLATLEWLREQNLYDHWRHQFLIRLNAELPNGQYENWGKVQPLFPHALLVSLQKPSTNDAIIAWAAILYKAAWYACEMEKVTEAELLSIQAMKAREGILDEEHEDVVSSKSMVALAYCLGGHWNKAEKLQVQVLETSKRKLGADHPSTLADMSNLSKTYRRQGRFEEAERLQVHVVKTRKANLGPDDPLTLNSIGRLAMMFSSQGRLEDAERLLVPVVKSLRTKRGASHPDTLANISGLVSIYIEQGRWEEAETLGLQLMEMCNTKLGADHWQTLAGIADLVSIYHNQGRWGETEKLQVQLIEARKKKLGESHLDTLRSINDLASTFWRQSRWEEAEKLQMQVMEAYKIKLGADHPETLSSINNLATTFSSQGRLEEAEKLQIQLMEIYKGAKLEADHPDLLVSMSNLATVFWHQGRWAEAETLQVQVLESDKMKLGAAHPSTLTDMNNLASTYRKQGRWKEAEGLQVQVLETRKAIFGADDPATLLSMNNLALTLENLGRRREALDLMERCAALRGRVLGPQHPATKASEEAVAFWHQR
ncbi:hypothetical protein NLG97_g4162 [Lecanicillium saksenae]|uniref:Uncharacterized protein n=1 Tax=Lecanicillium saksenae TaxID=468837 RepID=A0ACC1QWM0_9HYPO|nr:hypothetical protein NLG97_g4162 [Lecanicillium saksenae]